MPTVTGAVPIADPPAPVQVIVNILLEIKLFSVSDPERALVPDQSLLAVQKVALVETQVKVDEPPYETLVGEAVIVTVGGDTAHDAETKTTAEAVPYPPVELLPVMV